jgi:hypothetical protein
MHPPQRLSLEVSLRRSNARPETVAFLGVENRHGPTQGLALRFRVTYNCATVIERREDRVGMTMADATQQFAAGRRRLDGWRRLLVIAMMALVVAFAFAATLSGQVLAAPAGDRIAVNMPLEDSGRLPVDRWDYALVEHGIHCLGHAVVRGEPTVFEPFLIGNEVYYPFGPRIVAALNVIPPERPPRP